MTYMAIAYNHLVTSEVLAPWMTYCTTTEPMPDMNSDIELSNLQSSNCQAPSVFYSALKPKTSCNKLISLPTTVPE